MRKKYTHFAILAALCINLCALTALAHAQPTASGKTMPAKAAKIKSDTPWWTVHALFFKQAEPADLVDRKLPILHHSPTAAEWMASLPKNHVPVPVEAAWLARCEQLKKAGYSDCWVVAWQQPMAAPFEAQPLLEPCDENDPSDEASTAPLTLERPTALEAADSRPEPLGMTTDPAREETRPLTQEEAPTAPKCQPQRHPIFQGQLTLSMTSRKAPRIALKLYASENDNEAPTVAWSIAQTLKMRRLHYLDHAQLGAIIQVMPSPEPPYIDDDALEE